MHKYRFFLVLSLLLASLMNVVNAQNFHLHMKGGEVKDFNASEVDSIVFDAPKVEGTTFKLSYTNLTATTVTLNVVPADNNVAYYYDCVTKEQLAESGSLNAIVEDYIAYLQQSYPTLSLEQILGSLLSKGPASDDCERLPAGTDFIFYAIPVNEQGKCYGSATTTNFTTLPAGDPADCTFDISYTDLTTGGCNMVVKPSDSSVRYWMGITTFADYPGDKALALNVKESIEQYAQQKGMTVPQVVHGVTFTGNRESAESGLNANTDYYIYAYAMDNTGAAAGKVYKLKFTTRASDYSDADVSLKYRYFNGDDLYAYNAEKYAKYKGKVLVQAVLTPNDAAANWAIALAANDYTDATRYPDTSTKNAVLQGGYITVTEKNYIANWGLATFLYFAADEAGVDGELHRLLVNIDKENARPATEIDTPAAAPLKAAQMLRLVPEKSGMADVQLRMNRKATDFIHRDLVK